MTEFPLAEEKKTGSPAQRILKCPLKGNKPIKCYYDSKTIPKCLGPKDLPGLTINLGRLWKGRLAELAEALADKPGVALTYEKTINQGIGQGECGKEFPEKVVHRLSIDFKEDYKSEPKREQSKTPAASEDADKKKWEAEKSSVLAYPEDIDKTAEKLTKLDNSGLLKKIIIRGYTDTRGELESNVKLSVRRAEWVKKALTQRYGILEDVPIEIVGCGEFHARESDPADFQDHRVATVEVQSDQASTQPEGYPDSPENIKVKINKQKSTEGEPKKKETIELEWDAVKGARSYNLYWSENFNITFLFYHHKDELKKIVDITEPQYIDEDSKIDKFFARYYLVTAVNDIGESLSSNTARVGRTLASETKMVAYYRAHYTHRKIVYDKSSFQSYYINPFTGKKEGIAFEDKRENYWEPWRHGHRGELRLDLIFEESEEEEKEKKKKTDEPEEMEKKEETDELIEFLPFEKRETRNPRDISGVQEILAEANEMVNLMLYVVGKVDKKWLESNNRKEDLLFIKSLINLWIPTFPSLLPVSPDQFYIQGSMDKSKAEKKDKTKEEIMHEKARESMKYEKEQNEITMTIGFDDDVSKKSLKKIKEMSRNQGKLRLEPKKGDLIIRFNTNQPS